MSNILVDAIRRITELERRQANMLRLGTVAEVDLAAARVRVTIGKVKTAPIPWLTHRAGGDRTWHAPGVGEQVLVLAPCGDYTQGLALPAVYQTAHPAPSASADVHTVVYSDGAVITYDRAAHALSAILPAGATAVLTADGGVTINGPTTINGDVQINGDVGIDGEETSTGDMTAGSISLQNHLHGGVQSGGAKTSKPE